MTELWSRIDDQAITEPLGVIFQDILTFSDLPQDSFWEDQTRRRFWESYPAFGLLLRRMRTLFPRFHLVARKRRILDHYHHRQSQSLLSCSNSDPKFAQGFLLKQVLPQACLSSSHSERSHDLSYRSGPSAWSFGS
jgi:hypothetical protein